MSKSKKPKVAPEKVKQKAVVKKTSGECEVCKNQCQDGLNYIELMKTGAKPKVATGVVCHG